MNEDAAGADAEASVLTGAPPSEAGEEGRGAPVNGRLPVTLYDRWRTAFHIDGVAFGREVRRLREARGWTQKDLHDRTGVPIPTLSELETGASAKPRVALTMTLAQAFGYEHPGALLGLPQPARPPGTDPAGPRTSPSERPPEGPGPMTLEALVASLLRGVWTAQDARPEAVGPGAGPVVTRLAGEAPPGGLRALGGMGTPVFVGAVFLVDPKTQG